MSHPPPDRLADRLLHLSSVRANPRTDAICFLHRTASWHSVNIEAWLARFEVVVGGRRWPWAANSLRSKSVPFTNERTRREFSRVSRKQHRVPLVGRSIGHTLLQFTYDTIITLQHAKKLLLSWQRVVRFVWRSDTRWQGFRLFFFFSFFFLLLARF